MEQSTARKESENSNPSLLSKLGDIMLLSLCFLLGCLPVITIGPATTALYDTAVHCIRRKEYGPYQRFSGLSGLNSKRPAFPGCSGA